MEQRRGKPLGQLRTLDVLTATPILTRGHAGDQTQSCDLVPRGIVVVFVGTIGDEGTLPTKKMDIAHLKFLDPIHFYLVIIAALGIDALALT